MADVGLTPEVGIGAGIGAAIATFGAWMAKRLIGEDVQQRLVAIEVELATVKTDVEAMKRSQARMEDMLYELVRTR